MKRHLRAVSALLFVLLLAVTACQKQRPSSQQAASVSEYATDAAAGDGVQRMYDYHFQDTLSLRGHQYIYSIDRHAVDSLPRVKDVDGLVYADNAYHLSIRCDGQTLLNRHFTKGSFASYLSEDMLRNGILDGMVYDASVDAEMAFAISVSFPQTDMLEPLLLRVDRNGGISIERDQRSENDFDDL